MPARKEPIEKLKTKIKKMVESPVVHKGNKVKVNGIVLFTYSATSIAYTRNRYYPSKVDSLVNEDFEVEILLNHENLKYIPSNPNPPRFSRNLISIFRGLSIDIEKVVIGDSINGVKDKVLHITSKIYDDFVKINHEERMDKATRFRNRVRPYLAKNFSVTADEAETERDYSLLLREVINSGQVTQHDIIALSSDLEKGEPTNIVIEKQINKQVDWLINTIEEILEVDNLTKPKAKDLGKSHFGFPKNGITGPEHLMEKILSRYGQATLFGVPALLNTDKYVTHSGNLSRSQFDIILINHLGDVEVVELKRPDETVLKFDPSRNKFYPSKDLSIAISQAERYITSVMKDNDEDYKIDGLKIREYLKREIGGSLFVETVRPTALIIIGSYKTISPAYDELNDSQRKKISKTSYNENSDRAYRELKAAFKNIKLLTYSELLEHARTRLQL